jgi:hypothetical protein
LAPRDVVPGQPWSDAIVEGIKQSRALLVILSTAANASDDVGREVELAADDKKIILCVRVEEIAPSNGLRYFLKRVQWIDAFPGPLETRIDSLAQTVVGVVEGKWRVVEVPPQEPEFDEVDLDDFSRPIRGRRGPVSRLFEDR